ncbi:MAG: hypothetical protein ACJ8HI_09715 [Massilia sp.]
MAILLKFLLNGNGNRIFPFAGAPDRFSLNPCHPGRPARLTVAAAEFMLRAGFLTIETP